MDFAASGGEAVVETELVEDVLEIINLHLRSELLSAHSAGGLRPFFACLFVERDAERAEPLEHVEEFAEGDVKQESRHRYEVNHSEKPMTFSLHEFVAHGEHQTGGSHGKDEQKWQDVFVKGLSGPDTLVG